MAKVTGIGGVFFKSTNDHQKLAQWYSHNLGIQLEPWGGAILKWTDDKSADQGLTVWHVAAKNTEWFSPSPSSFMINYRVDNMSEMLANLKRNGVEILKGPESDDNGTFAWILDPDGNKVELWQPVPREENNKTK
jgi:predicted enzyme related to lactoylglutathione lyase